MPATAKETRSPRTSASTALSNGTPPAPPEPSAPLGSAKLILKDEVRYGEQRIQKGSIVGEVRGIDLSAHRFKKLLASGVLTVAEPTAGPAPGNTR